MNGENALRQMRDDRTLGQWLSELDSSELRDVATEVTAELLARITILEAGKEAKQ
jgi:hypothetical protein